MQPTASDRPVSPLDVLMYRGENDPRTRTAMVGVYLLDRAPSWSDFVTTSTTPAGATRGCGTG